MALQPFVGPWPPFQCLHLHTELVKFHGRGISPAQGRYLHTGQHKQNKRTQTFIPQVGLEPTIPVFEKAKTFHDSDSAATAMGSNISRLVKKIPHTLRNPKVQQACRVHNNESQDTILNLMNLVHILTLII
jgi:hypothetical protein